MDSGEANHEAKLTREEVRRIKVLWHDPYLSNVTMAKLATHFEVSRKTIHDILTGTTWSHVDKDEQPGRKIR